MSSRVTRLAPSPTGALHLGNLRTFLINWALARRGGWRIIMRLEDLDSPRVKPGAADELLDILRWVGLDWDGPVLVQSQEMEPCREAMRSLAGRGLVYPCELSRTEIEAAASAPHGREGELRFPSSLRPATRPGGFTDDRTNWRFVVSDRIVEFEDGFAGRIARRPAAECGDFVVWTKRGQAAYQLAVVVDDARQGVTDVIRGDDLLDSAARQILLIEALQLSPQPRYVHVPLVVGPDGRRLAKRHGDTRVAQYRALGAAPERLIGLMGFWSGVIPRRAWLSISEFRDAFDLATLPRGPITFTSEDDQWLRQR